MKYILAILIVVNFANISFAQQDTTLIYNSPMYIKDPVRSKWRPVITRDGDLFKVTFYDRKDIIKEIIHFEDKNLEVRKGLYQSYDAKGLGLSQEGEYDKGHKNGKWKTYNTATNKLTSYTHYNYGKKEGEFKEFWDFETDKIKYEGIYQNNKKFGVWKSVYEEGKIAAIEEYDYKGVKIKGEYFDLDGKSIKYEDLESPPSFEGGIKEFYRFLGSSIKYPSEAVKNRITGTVFVSFNVEKDGRLSDIKAERSPDEDLSYEAIRVLKQSPKWIPGKQFGKPVRVKYNLPVKFSL